ncbi:hypothetical protein ACFVVU_09015 [Kitasatospora sp. NPDC057965]|uniref:hypothetical protein n=1 Tax=Kitasatospora sp. NPDC057965 TaxID=3346291 RepID=UPI0036D83089
MNRYGKAALAALGLLMFFLGMVVLLGLVPAGSWPGSVLRAVGFGPLMAAALVWDGYISKTFRRKL